MPGEKAVVQAGEDLQLRFWDVRDMLTPVQTLEGHVNIPHCCDVTADGHYVISSSNGRAWLTSLATSSASDASAASDASDTSLIELNGIH